MVDLEQKISDLPDKSGVYIMQDAGGNIIYIGKARSLKNRVKQYFSNSAKPEKVMAMVSKARDFRYIITKTEMDALCLEANLIKKHKPQYNILLKDDKAYPYIKINLNAEYPKIEIIRKLKNDGAKYFGPFVGVSVKDLARLISEVYPLRTCNYNFNKPKKNHRPCLNYDIKLCLAPCAGRTDKATYAAVVQRLIKFLNGFDEYAKNILNDKMLTASQNEDFENAIAYREKLQLLEKLKYKKIAELPRDINMDVFAYTTDGKYSVVSAHKKKGGKIISTQKY
jgi:excinuclease ABC subunit C